MMRPARCFDVRRCPRGRHASAFTLVELLVVMMIIGVLIAILLPALRGALDLARNIQCQSNLSAIAKAALNYTTDYNGAILPTKTATGMYWCDILVDRNYLTAENSAGADPTQPARTSTVLKCPVALDSLFVTEPPAVTLTRPSEDNAQATWRLGPTATIRVDCSYYWNGYVGTSDVSRARFPSLLLGGSSVYQVHDISEIRQRSTLVMVADGILYADDTLNTNTIKARIAARHPGWAGSNTKTNIAFYDGHVESLSRIPGTNNSWSTDPIMSSSGLDTTLSPLFMLPTR